MAATLFDSYRAQMTDSIRLSLESLNAYGPRYPDWCVAWSGGKDGTLCKNQQRMGPLTLEARGEGLQRLLAIQAEVNAAADRLGRPRVDHLDLCEEARIRALIANGTWPDGWDGTEPVATEEMPPHFADGSVQGLLWGALEDTEG